MKGEFGLEPIRRSTKQKQKLFFASARKDTSKKTTFAPCIASNRTIGGEEFTTLPKMRNRLFLEGNTTNSNSLIKFTITSFILNGMSLDPKPSIAKFSL
jgi:hypothetical protein